MLRAYTTDKKYVTRILEELDENVGLLNGGRHALHQEVLDLVPGISR